MGLCIDLLWTYFYLVGNVLPFTKHQILYHSQTNHISVGNVLPFTKHCIFVWLDLFMQLIVFILIALSTYLVCIMLIVYHTYCCNQLYIIGSPGNCPPSIIGFFIVFYKTWPLCSITNMVVKQWSPTDPKTSFYTWKDFSSEI